MDVSYALGVEVLQSMQMVGARGPIHSDTKNASVSEELQVIEVCSELFLSALVGRSRVWVDAGHGCTHTHAHAGKEAISCALQGCRGRRGSSCV